MDERTQFEIALERIAREGQAPDPQAPTARFGSAF